MSVLAMKFGGTSVGSSAAIGMLCKIVLDQKTKWDNVVVVVSAMSGVTDILINGANAAAKGDKSSTNASADALRKRHISTLGELADGHSSRNELARQIEVLISEYELLIHAVGVLGEASPRAIDAIASLGERMSVRLVTAALLASGISAQAVDANSVVLTTSEFGNGAPIYPQTRTQIRTAIMPMFAQGITPVITGFIGATASGAITTLGRGGSDYSGAIFGEALDADEVDIYTDVDGVMTTDPRLVKHAKVLNHLSYAEMSELAYFGAKVLHPKTIRPVIERGIPIRIRNTFNPSHVGTLVTRVSEPTTHAIRAVTVIRNMNLITVEGRGMIGVQGVAARTFSAVAHAGANVLMISQASSEQSICFVIPNKSTQPVINELEQSLKHELERGDIDQIKSRDEVVIVTVVGVGIHERPGVAAKVFSAIAEAKVNILVIAQGSSECSISIVVAASDGDIAVKALHELALA
ncbi:MAG: aspartate kinase [Chloroflexales bacterium]|nr:aspartate kinase [Chloroflexales bacterium]